jgi:hypothetical protein
MNSKGDSYWTSHEGDPQYASLIAATKAVLAMNKFCYRDVAFSRRWKVLTFTAEIGQYRKAVIEYHMTHLIQDVPPWVSNVLTPFYKTLPEGQNDTDSDPIEKWKLLGIWFGGSVIVVCLVLILWEGFIVFWKRRREFKPSLEKKRARRRKVTLSKFSLESVKI